MQIRRIVFILALGVLVACGFACEGEGERVSTPTLAPVATPKPMPTPTHEQTPTPTHTPSIPPGGYIEVVVDEIERTQVLPDGLVDHAFDPRPALPDEGYDYVVLHLALVKVEKGNGPFFLGAQLLDSQGDEHALFGSKFTGVRFLDPNDLESPVELVEGGSTILAFELPEQAVPVTLSFTYAFREYEVGKPWMRPQIDITL